jgi:hypothetical protein
MGDTGLEPVTSALSRLNGVGIEGQRWAPLGQKALEIRRVRVPVLSGSCHCFPVRCSPGVRQLGLLTGRCWHPKRPARTWAADQLGRDGAVEQQEISFRVRLAICDAARSLIWLVEADSGPVLTRAWAPQHVWCMLASRHRVLSGAPSGRCSLWSRISLCSCRTSTTAGRFYRSGLGRRGPQAARLPAVCSPPTIAIFSIFLLPQGRARTARDGRSAPAGAGQHDVRAYRLT